MNTIYITSSQYIYLLPGYDQSTQIYYNFDFGITPQSQSAILYTQPILISQNTLINAINYNTITLQYSDVESIQFIRLLNDPYLYYTDSK